MTETSTMNLRSVLGVALLVVGSVMGAACDDSTRRPKAAVWLSGLKRPTPANSLECALDGVQDGQGIHVWHELHAEIRTEHELEILVETPCVSEPKTIRHDSDGIARATLVAPPGASCGLTVTLRIANSVEACTLLNADSTSTTSAIEDCEDVADVCDETMTSGSSSSSTG